MTRTPSAIRMTGKVFTTYLQRLPFYTPRNRKSMHGSSAHHLCVDGPGKSGIFGALHNGPAILEEREFVRRGRASQQKLVVLNFPGIPDGFGKPGKIQVTPDGRNQLNRITAAKSDGAQRLSIQVVESAFGANRTDFHGIGS